MTFTGGYLISLFGDLTAWRSYKRSQIYTFTTKTEYAAMSEAWSQSIPIDKAARDMTGEEYYPHIVWFDNAAAGKTRRRKDVTNCVTSTKPSP